MAQKRTLPTKAFDINARWTAQIPVQGWRHYRISARKSQKSALLMVEMMAVCDRSVRFWLERQQLIDDENWATGWLDGAP
jgi:tryptophan-rich hypothetical protein